MEKNKSQNPYTIIDLAFQNSIDAFETLLLKLGVLKQQHQEKEINIYSIKNKNPEKKIYFQDLIKFLREFGLQLKQEEENVLKKSLCDIDRDWVYIQDFLGFMNLKDTYQSQYQIKHNILNPEEEENQYQYNVPKINVIQINNLEQQRPTFLNNIQQIAQQQFQNQLDRHKEQDGKIWDVMKSYIQTVNYYEKEDQNLLGYDQFIKKFQECEQQIKKFTDSDFQPISNSLGDVKDSKSYNVILYMNYSFKQIFNLKKNQFELPTLSQIIYLYYFKIHFSSLQRKLKKYQHIFFSILKVVKNISDI